MKINNAILSGVKMKFNLNKKDYLYLILFIILLINTVCDAQIIPQWVAKYNGPGVNKSDVANAVCTDAGGNVYIAGAVESYDFNFNYATIKYNSEGQMQWIAKYSDTSDFQSWATAIAVDNSGNVYVTGYSGTGLGHYNHFETIKYNSSGMQQWTAEYQGPVNSDYARAIAVDDSGNVYVTGESHGGTTTLNDIAVIKYNSSGVQQWVERWNGPGNNSDQPTSIALDNSGNVYVTGFTINGNITSYGTISYNSSGVLRWASIYNPPDNYTSIANGIVIDHQGFVYVSGRSHGLPNSVDPYYKFATIKYNPNTGDTIWVKRYGSTSTSQNWGYGIAVDNINNIYVSGAINVPNTETWRIGVVKYNSNGVQQWATVYLDQNKQFNYGEKIVVDAYGNSFVQGYSKTGLFSPEDYMTATFDANGNFRWIKYYDGPSASNDLTYGIALDSSGNCIVTGKSNAGNLNTTVDYLTIKYNSSGDQLWTARYNNSVRGDEILSEMKTDNLGNIYLAGTSPGQTSSKDMLVVKFNKNGDTLWTGRFNGPSNTNDQAYALNVDSSGNVYVAGQCWNPDAEHATWATLKYDSSGVLLWSSLYVGSGGGGIMNAAHSVAFDQNGNIYVYGLESSYNSAAGQLTLIKYDPNGNQQWVKHYGTMMLGNAVTKVLVDKDGFIYITGELNKNIYTLKYDSSGNTLWIKYYDGPGNYIDIPNDLYVDNNNNVYITGSTMQSTTNGSQDFVTLKYNSAGILQWDKFYNGPGNNYDAAKSITVDPIGNVFTTGLSFGSGTDYDYTTIKYDSAGNEIWVERYNGNGNSADYGTSIALNNDKLYVIGGTGSVTSMGFGLVQYDDNGNQLNYYEYNSNDDSIHVKPFLKVDNDGNLYSAGSTFEDGTDYDFVLIKYTNSVPVELTDFSSSITEDGVTLNWKTETETNNNGFEIERKKTADKDKTTEWNNMGFVPGHGTISIPSSYSFTDDKLSAGTYYYRLKQIDFNGDYKYSNEIKVNYSAPISYKLEQNFPNPFNPSTSIKYSISENSHVKISIYDMLGKLVETLVNKNETAGIYSVKWNASNLAAGVYIYRIDAVSENGNENFSSVKKMILLK